MLAVMSQNLIEVIVVFVSGTYIQKKKNISYWNWCTNFHVKSIQWSMPTIGGTRVIEEWIWDIGRYIRVHRISWHIHNRNTTLQYVYEENIVLNAFQYFPKINALNLNEHELLHYSDISCQKKRETDIVYWCEANHHYDRMDTSRIKNITGPRRPTDELSKSPSGHRVQIASSVDGVSFHLKHLRTCRNSFTKVSIQLFYWLISVCQWNDSAIFDDWWLHI